MKKHSSLLVILAILLIAQHTLQASENGGGQIAISIDYNCVTDITIPGILFLFDRDSYDAYPPPFQLQPFRFHFSLNPEISLNASCQLRIGPFSPLQISPSLGISFWTKGFMQEGIRLDTTLSYHADWNIAQTFYFGDIRSAFGYGWHNGPFYRYIGLALWLPIFFAPELRTMPLGEIIISWALPF